MPPMLAVKLWQYLQRPPWLWPVAWHRPQPRPEAWLPRSLPRSPCAFPSLLSPCESAFDLRPPLPLLLFDELLFPFEVQPPFLRRPRLCPRLPCLRNSHAPPCTVVLSEPPGRPEPSLGGTLPRICMAWYAVARLAPSSKSKAALPCRGFSQSSTVLKEP